MRSFTNEVDAMLSCGSLDFLLGGHDCVMMNTHDSENKTLFGGGDPEKEFVLFVQDPLRDVERLFLDDGEAKYLNKRCVDFVRF